MDGTVALSQLNAGGRGRVIAMTLPRDLRHRLTSMGLIVGTEVTCTRGARLGPCIVGVRGGQVILGHALAKNIRLTLIADPGKKAHAHTPTP